MLAPCRLLTVGACPPPRLPGRLPPAFYQRRPGSKAWAVAAGTESGSEHPWAGEVAESKGLGPPRKLLSPAALKDRAALKDLEAVQGCCARPLIGDGETFRENSGAKCLC